MFNRFGFQLHIVLALLTAIPRKLVTQQHLGSVFFLTEVTAGFLKSIKICCVSSDYLKTEHSNTQNNPPPQKKTVSVKALFSFSFFFFFTKKTKLFDFHPNSECHNRKTKVCWNKRIFRVENSEMLPSEKSYVMEDVLMLHFAKVI